MGNESKVGVSLPWDGFREQYCVDTFALRDCNYQCTGGERQSQCRECNAEH